MEGEHFKVGQKFTTKSCTAQCTCTGDMAIGCVSLCPPSRIECTPGFIESTIDRPIGDGRCTCPEPVCVPGTLVSD